MKFTKEGEDAVKIVLYLSNIDDDKIVNANEISEAEGITDKMVLKILRKLAHGKIVSSFRGVHGGYKLKKNPEKLSIKDVVEFIQGELSLTTTLKGVRSKEKIKGNIVDEFLFDIQSEIRNKLTTTTFADLKEISKANKK